MRTFNLIRQLEAMSGAATSSEEEKRRHGGIGGRASLHGGNEARTLELRRPVHGTRSCCCSCGIGGGDSWRSLRATSRQGARHLSPGGCRPASDIMGNMSAAGCTGSTSRQGLCLLVITRPPACWSAGRQRRCRRALLLLPTPTRLAIRNRLAKVQDAGKRCPWQTQGEGDVAVISSPTRRRRTRRRSHSY